MAQTPYFIKLENRGLVHIEGADRHEFLQNIITNDIDTLEAGVLIYACLLSPQGKFLHDFFVSRGDGFLLLECEGGERAQDLYKRLSLYRLRAEVKISVVEQVPVYAGFGFNGLPDPRHMDMGVRSFEKPDIEERPFAEWDRHRIVLCVPDGSRDLIVNSSTLEEGHIDKLNGVSYEKGCYVGQELTARMHHRGLGKKHLYTVRGNLPQSGREIIRDGKSIGDMRSKQGDIGIALLKDEYSGVRTI